MFFTLKYILGFDYFNIILQLIIFKFMLTKEKIAVQKSTQAVIFCQTFSVVIISSS